MIKIEINCDADGLEAHMKALGFSRSVVVPHDTWGKGLFVDPPTLKLRPDEEQSGAMRDDLSAEMTSEQTAEHAKVEEIISDMPVSPEVAKAARVPGQPSPGKRRRTAAEVAEDEKLAAMQLAGKATAPLISTGGERVDPATAAADEADEAAETAANKTGLTLDDVRAAFGVYMKKVGSVRAVATIRGLLGSPIAEIPATQEAYAAAIEKIVNAAATEPAEGAPEAPPEPAPHATREDVVEAIKAYGRKYDGSDVPTNMPITLEDTARLMQALFGEGITDISTKRGFIQTPENYGKVLATLNEALRNNPFKRAVKS